MNEGLYPYFGSKLLDLLRYGKRKRPCKTLLHGLLIKDGVIYLKRVYLFLKRF